MNQETDKRTENMSDMEEEALKSGDWETHMRISPLRQSLLNWYEFDRDSSLLELNAGSGALTGLFCRRCRNVTALTASPEEKSALEQRCEKNRNLCVKNETVQDLLQKGQEPFDYIVAVNVIEHAEDPAQAVREWMKLLKPEGILLLTVENRYGLKYFCGAGDPYTGLPYDGINGYLHGTEGRGKCLGRQEVLAALRQAGDLNYQFYYPVPDDRMPQMIFSDFYQKGQNAAERLVDYDYTDGAMLGVEHRMFSEMIDDGALPFMANSFLLEITREGELSDIIYAVTTTDRGAGYGTATTIRKSGLVKKRPLWPEGEANIRKLHAYTEDLVSHGIPVVKTELEADSRGIALSMPYIEEEGLSSVLKRLAEENPEKAVEIFDRIYAYIRAASVPLPGTRDAGEEILQTAYLDLAPCNCFYVKSTDSLLFYDQEFAVKNCPAKFAMFRTLKYCYASARSMDQSVPLRDLYRRYGISEDQTAEFELREREFIESVRNMEKYKRMFQWATPDYERIYARMKKTAAAPGVKPYRTGYVPGVFDLFHTGHLNLLERCKARCDYLIVGVLTDELVEYYKGTRTVISYESRARLIAALSTVDEVIPVDFSNTDKLDAWEQLHYDCHFSGDDHLNHWNDTWEELKKRGSNMEFFPYTPNISSTQIRNTIRDQSFLSGKQA